MAATVSNIVVLRPGALGDVLVVRNLLCWLKCVFPQAKTTLAAPGRRGELLRQPGLADAWLDWESAAFAWLFSSDVSSAPPEMLVELFTKNTLVLAYLDLRGEQAVAFQQRLSRLASPLFLFMSPSRPEEDGREFIGTWLVGKAGRYCRAQQLDMVEGRVAASGFVEQRIVVPDCNPDVGVLLIHPGSGSAKKNWPLESFRKVGELFLQDSSAGIRSICITSGDADGQLGVALAESLPGAAHWHQPDLTELAQLVGNASLYFGNDSGVSHLAASVQTASGHRPKVGIIFGPSNSRVWGQPGTLLLEGGDGFAALSPEEAYSRLRRRYVDGSN